jgi:hypothetical protein
MMQKPRTGYGRSRVTPRDGRRSAPPADQDAAQVAAARRVAAAFVAARWPELAAVRPAVAVRKPPAPSAELLARLGLEGVELAGRPGPRYTFTFCGAKGTTDGHESPLVAVVTVDDGQRIVKTSVTR